MLCDCLMPFIPRRIRIPDYQQIHVAVICRLAVRVRTEQNYFLGMERIYDPLDRAR